MLFLSLEHGRDSLEIDIENRGSKGPVLGPLPVVKVSYGYHVFIGFDFLPLKIIDGCIEYKGRYYGDFVILPASEVAKRGYKTEVPEGLG